MQKRTFGLILAAALLVAISAPASAQVVGPRLGVIPGTTMTRDEFRARAQATLAAVALNAVTHLLYNGSYPPDFYALQTSRAWNIKPQNMFTGRPLQLIYFEPSADTMTTAPSLGIAGSFELPSAAPQTGGPVAERGPNGEFPKDVQFTAKGGGGPLRPDPKAMRDIQGGDIWYYTRGDLLQLVIFAPDGSYVEWLDEIPNANYRASLNMRPDQPKENLYAAQVLYYVDTLAPQYYNLVQFMADDTTVPGAAVSSLPASKKIELAGRMGIEIDNPVTRQPATAAKEPAPGVIIEGTPLKVVTADGKAQALTEMTLAREDPQQTRPTAKPKPVQKPRPGSRPPGGRTPGAPGGGRR